MENAGSGGTIVLETPQLHLEDGAKISAITKGAGKAANIKIDADNVTLRGGSQIFASSDGSGDGGTIVLTAEQLILEGINTNSEDENEGKGNRIMANAVGEMADAGDSGTITLTLGHLQLSDGAQISASTFGPGQGGQIDITVTKEAHLSDQDQQKFRSGLFTSSQSQADNAGDSGAINFSVGDLYLTDDAEIYAETWGSGQGGNIAIQAQNILMAAGGRITARSGDEDRKASGNAGKITLSIGNRLFMREGTIRTSAEIANGGGISITSPSYIYLQDSKITATVNEEFGSGGNLDLAPEFVVLDNSKLFAKAKQGQGGNINITTTWIYNFTGEPIADIINASSEFGVDGEVNITSPDIDMSSKLLVLPTNYVSAKDQLQSPCSARLADNLSSFIMIASEGAAPSPGDLLPSGPRLSPLIDLSMLSEKTGQRIQSRRFPTVALLSGCRPKLGCSRF